MDYAIVLLSFNHENLTRQCLKSIFATDFKAKNLYLVHNGSLPNKVMQLELEFPDIQHVKILKNQGYSGGANFGLRTAFEKFENVFFLTNDTEVIQLPGTFPKNKDYFAIPIYVRNTGRLHSLFGELDPIKGGLRHSTNFAVSSNLYSYIPGTAFGLTKKSFNLLNGFDESFHTYWEDVDLSYRARRMGIPISKDETFTVKHKIGKTCHKDRFYTLYLFQRNRRWFMKKHDLLNIKFYKAYYFDLGRIAFRLIKKPADWPYFKFLAKVIYESRTDAHRLHKV